MKYVFEKNLSCNNETFEQCNNDIVNSIELKFPNIKFHAEEITDKVNGHISISHDNKKHKIWVFVYDKNGIHEGESLGKTVFNESNRIEKITGKFPTEADFIKAIDQNG